MPDYFGNANLWVYRRSASGVEVLFQKRSPLVSGNPNKYDVSAGGHIDPGETPVEAAVREAREELGIAVDPKSLRPLLDFPVEDGRTFFVFTCDWTGRPDVFHLNPEEVSEVQWVPLADLDRFVAAGAKKPLRESTAQLTTLKTFLAQEA